MAGHGFRLRYPAQLLDAPALMRYFGEKIGIGHCCMHCGRQFRSLAAVRDHMAGKAHCNYELDDEYEEFYQPDTSVVPAVGAVDAVGELHVNGRVYGHRMYRRYYRQRLHDPAEFAARARRAITGPVAPRESVALATDPVARKREFFRQKGISKRERRLVSRDYHPFADIHRGNA
jgi:pre-60S factor REI1